MSDVENSKIDMNDVILGDAVHIIIRGEPVERKVITKYINDVPDNVMTFENALTIAKENGFKSGTFLMVVENSLCPMVYEYVNCYSKPYWHEYGTTVKEE